MLSEDDMTTETIHDAVGDEDLSWKAKARCIGAGLGFIELATFLLVHIVMAGTIDVTVVGLTIFAGAALLLPGLGLRQLGEGGLWSISGLFYAGAALVILLEPFLGLSLVTLALAILLAISGLARLVIGAHEHVQWILLSGCVTVLAGTAIGMDWSENALTIVGGLLAIDLAAQGVALILSGLTHRLAVIEEEA
ncbi:hypothetical protein HY78_08240 [Rhizorhabdus wittichii DC-6]|nr:hypothetical protein HY78_08240 [Rhizorhabdus wittichii DC-6]